jgi:hypothetical protein
VTLVKVHLVTDENDVLREEDKAYCRKLMHQVSLKARPVSGNAEKTDGRNYATVDNRCGWTRASIN